MVYFRPQTALFCLLLNFAFSKHRLGQKRHTGTKRIQKYLTPCQIPGIENDLFETVCTQYFLKPYVCMKSDTNLLSKTMVGRFEEILAGKFAYCRYDRIRKVADKLPIGDNMLIKRDTMMRRAEVVEQKIKKENGLLRHPPATKPKLPPLKLRPMERRLTIGLTIADSFREVLDPNSIPFNPNYRRKLATECGLTPPELRHSPNRTITNALYDFYANATRALWSYATCETDLAVLLLGDVKRREEVVERVPSIHVSLTPDLASMFGNSIHELAAEINREGVYKPGRRLEHFFLALEALLEEQYPAQPFKKYHTIPPWACFVFVGCGLLSLVSAILGHLAQSARKGRGSFMGLGKKSGDRKWAAGFSGGMWGAS